MTGSLAVGCAGSFVLTWLMEGWGQAHFAPDGSVPLGDTLLESGTWSQPHDSEVLGAGGQTPQSQLAA